MALPAVEAPSAGAPRSFRADRGDKPELERLGERMRAFELEPTVEDPPSSCAERRLRCLAGKPACGAGVGHVAWAEEAVGGACACHDNQLLTSWAIARKSTQHLCEGGVSDNKKATILRSESTIDFGRTTYCRRVCEERLMSK
jgi:hypothetical protein